MREQLLILLAVVICLPGSVRAESLRVPTTYGTIQAAVAAAAPGDTVLVADGTYHENVDFRGKEIVLTSEFALDGDPAHILATVIDGSQPDHPDSGSCVMLLSAEGPGAVLQGFTITGGSGTSYGFGGGTVFFREGGGIILDRSQATIRDNIVVDNAAVPGHADQGSGGGGISAIESSPTITHNLIMHNTANYACGLVLNWSGGAVTSNIVYGNHGGEQYGTAGIMVWESPAWTAVVANNTVVGNRSESTAGGISVTNTSAHVRNNIVWGNRQAVGGPVTGVQTSQVIYNACDAPLSGTGNIMDFPRFTDSGLMLAPDSPCIDAGIQVASYNDPEDPDRPGLALWPALGTVRNDIGAYGGPLAALFPEIARPGELACPTATIEFGEVVPPDGAEAAATLISYSAVPVRVTDVQVSYVVGDGLTCAEPLPWVLPPLATGELTLSWQPASGGDLAATVALYHDGAGLPNPILIEVTGTAVVVAAPQPAPRRFGLRGNVPNPFNPATEIRFELAERGRTSVTVYDLAGRRVARLFDADLEPGRHAVDWSGRDDRGLAVGSGTYIYRVAQRGRVLDGRMTLAK